MDSTGLILIDLTNNFFNNLSLEDQDLLKETIPTLVELAQKKEIPILTTQWGLDEKIVSFLEKYHLKKVSRRYDSNSDNVFEEKKVKNWVEEYSLDSIIYAGVNANECVLSSIKGGNNLDLKTITAYDIIAQGKTSNRNFFDENNLKRTVNEYFQDLDDLIKKYLD